MTKKTFVLIHGSWHSAWNWYKVKPLLEALDCQVIAPDLPGMGRDKTLLKDVSFNSTVKGLCVIIEAIHGKIILVGHSKNGVLISQIAENIPHKIDKLVYLAAILAQNGKSAVDYFKLDTEEVLGPHIEFDSISNSSILLPRIYKEGLYHDCDSEIVELAKIILCSEPKQTATTPIRITEENFGSIPRYYIECTEDRAITPLLQKQMYSEMPCKNTYQIKASHSPFFSKPQELVNVLIEISND